MSSEVSSQSRPNSANHSSVNLPPQELGNPGKKRLGGRGEDKNIGGLQGNILNHVHPEKPLDNKFEQVAQGAVKRVWKKPGNETQLFYTVKKKSKLKELFDEVKVSKEVDKSLVKGGEIKNKHRESIMPAPVLLDRSEWINGEETFQVEKREGDLDAVLRGKLNVDGKTVQVETKGILKIIKNIFLSVAGMHDANLMHGDLKPDNFLFSAANESVQLSDFGKAQAIKDGEVKMHKGNTRTGNAPEGIDTKKSETWSSGIMAIYSLEQKSLNDDRMSYIVNRSEQQIRYISSKIEEIDNGELPNKNELIKNYTGVIKKINVYSSEVRGGNYENYDKLKKILIMVQKTKNKSERRADEQTMPKRKYRGDMLIHTDINVYSARKSKRVGIEKFMVFNPDCPQGESSGLQNIKVRIRSVFKFAMAKLFPKSKPNVEAPNPVHDYIDALFDVLKNDTAMEPSKCEEFKKLLKDMTEIDPSKRPDMDTVVSRYDMLFPEKAMKEMAAE